MQKALSHDGDKVKELMELGIAKIRAAGNWRWKTYRVPIIISTPVLIPSSRVVKAQDPAQGIAWPVIRRRA